MRIRFQKGKQRDLILSFKKEKKKTWVNLASFLGISLTSLFMRVKEKTLLLGAEYKMLDPLGVYDPFIQEKLDENWGKKKGGLSSSGTTKDINIPPFSEQLAELVGIILGDGNVHFFQKGTHNWSYMVRIAGHYTEDRDYLSNHVIGLFRNQFGIEPKLHFQPSHNEMFVILHSKKLVDFLVTIGLHRGNKLKWTTGIPGWILQDRKYLTSCLRGLIDTDGSIYQMSNQDPHLLRIGFKNFNPTILSSVRDGFIQLGFHPSKIMRGVGFTLSRKEDIGNFLINVPFSNSKHLNRIKKFVSPVV